ncbi:MAG: DUF3368 domain-containing protein [Candidatus Binatales bacterium]
MRARSSVSPESAAASPCSSGCSPRSTLRDRFAGTSFPEPASRESWRSHRHWIAESCAYSIWLEPQFPWLHDGEASTLRAAINLRRPCLVLIDEREARKTLRSLSSDTIGVSGTIAVVGAAKQRGLIPSAKAVFEELQRKNFYVSRALVAGILESTGEARIPPVAAPKSSTRPQRAKRRRRRK